MALLVTFKRHNLDLDIFLGHVLGVYGLTPRFDRSLGHVGDITILKVAADPCVR